MLFQELPAKLGRNQLKPSLSFDNSLSEATHLCHWNAFDLPIITGQSKCPLEKDMLSIFTINKSNTYFNKYSSEEDLKNIKIWNKMYNF